MTSGKDKKVIAFVLAAGCSKRFGKQMKQLLAFRGKTILQTVVDEACGSKAVEVFTVLGCRWRKIKLALKPGRSRIIINKDYERGFSTSLQAAVRKTLQLRADACLIVLADQPLVNAEFLNELIAIYQGKEVSGVVSDYGGVIGTPAILDKKLFPDVMKLKGEIGAKQLLEGRTDVIKVKARQEMLTDVDTEEDYRKILKIR
ncbi:MAG: nucleotidyltransferase family protein [Conexivisphaerales archaeon]